MIMQVLKCGQHWSYEEDKLYKNVLGNKWSDFFSLIIAHILGIQISMFAFFESMRLLIFLETA